MANELSLARSLSLPARLLPSAAPLAAPQIEDRPFLSRRPPPLYQPRRQRYHDPRGRTALPARVAQAQVRLQGIEGWLNIAEIELAVLANSCLSRRIPDEATLHREVEANVCERNAKATPVKWRFTVQDARRKLARLYPAVST